MARICILRHSYYPQETHVRRNAETLAQEGHRVDVLCLRAAGQPSREVISGVTVHRLPLQRRKRGVARYLFEHSAFFLMAATALPFLHVRRRFDYVEVDTMPDSLTFATILPKLLGSKVVLYLFEAMPELVTYKYGARPGHSLFRLSALIEQAAIRYADRVITACEAFRSAFVARGASRAKIAVVLNVPDERVFNASQVRHQAEPGRQDLRLITHGTLTELYGVQVAIQAVAELRPRLPGLTLLVAGDGPYRPALEQLARDLHVDDLVTFTGWVPQGEVATLIRQADVGLVPILSGYGEYMVPNKLFEYVALKTPAVVSSLKGIQDYFDDDSLLFHEPGHAPGLAACIERLYRDQGLRETIVRRAFQVYEQHRWDRAKAIYCGLYDVEHRPPSQHGG